MIFIEWIKSRATRMHAVMNSKDKNWLTDLFLRESLFIADVISEVSSSEVVHH